jgi:predicted nucleic acid-binding protein
MILVDSSVWIGYFRGDEKSNLLSNLIELDLVCTNEIILSELLPALQHRKQQELIDSLLALPCMPLDIFWEGIRALQVLNIQNGVNKVGIPDLIIAQQCINSNLEIWTFDKHFRFISQYTTLKMSDL